MTTTEFVVWIFLGIASLGTTAQFFANHYPDMKLKVSLIASTLMFFWVLIVCRLLYLSGHH